MYNGYTFLGATTATLLLGQLATIRIEADETITDFVLRLQVLFDDLELVPGDANYVFNDVQRLGYLLQVIRHEPDLAHQHQYIQAASTRGVITFEAACDDLIVRDDALRADLLLNSSSRPRKALAAKEKAGSTGLISTAAKKKAAALKPAASGSDSASPPKKLCLVEGCDQKRSRGMCKRHYVEIVSGKVQSHVLCNGWGTATYNATSGIVFPPAVPADRRMSGEFTPRVHFEDGA